MWSSSSSPTWPSAPLPLLASNPAASVFEAGAGVIGLILPVTLAVTLAASFRKDITGDYKRPELLVIPGFALVVLMGFFGIKDPGPIISMAAG